MPIPLFLIPLVTSAALLDKAHTDRKDAIETNDKANSIIENSKQNLEKAKIACSSALENLGSKKMFMLDTSIKTFIECVESIKNIDLERPVELNEVSKFRMDKSTYTELKKIGSNVSSIAIEVGSRTAVFALLGSVVNFSILGSAIPIFGEILICAKANTQKNKAYENLAIAKKTAEEIKTTELLCNGIRRRSNMFYNLLVRLDSLFIPLVIQTENAIKEHNGNYREFTLDQKHTVAATFAIASAIKAVLDTPLLSKDGNLTKASEQLIPQVNEQIKIQQSKPLALPVNNENTVVKCAKCGKLLNNHTKFCTNCGTKIKI